MEMIRFGDQYFSKDLYDVLMTGFKESFAHTSLSIERAFTEYRDCNAKLEKLHNNRVYLYYKLLEKKEARKIDDCLKRFIVYRGYQYGIIKGTFDINTPQPNVDKLFDEYFRYMLEEAHFFLAFTPEGEFDQKATFYNTNDYFQLAFKKETAKKIAYDMQKDHLYAFDYALSLDKIGIPEIIKINEIINNSNPDKEIGYKQMNNFIQGANFNVTDKKNVPVEMQILMADYKNNFDLDIKDINEAGISEEELHERILKVFEREAIFHIRFERIHPFADGNGRTGRIIMNKHLIDEGLVPVLFSEYTINKYKKCIENYDYKELAEMMANSSSQLLASWVSMRKINIRPGKIEKNNEKLATISTGEKIKRLGLFTFF